jgi:hypothetical protein
MKKVYLVYDGRYGFEGMFDESGKLLGAWACTMAQWRPTQFDEFMRNLNVEVVPSSETALVAKMQKVAEEMRRHPHLSPVKYAS